MSTVDRMLVALLSFWVCISVVGNASVIACIWKTSQDNKKFTGRSSLTSTEILIISLAVNDILLAGIVLPQKIHDISHTHDYFECTFYFLLRLLAMLIDSFRSFNCTLFVYLVSPAITHAFVIKATDVLLCYAF